LRHAGADVHTIGCDAADRGALGATLDELAEAGVRVGGVIHAAGVLDDCVLDALTVERLDRILRPKVDAAVNLHDLTEHLDLTAFVVFSSLAGTLGSAGQAGYAAGNAFLDGLVEHRRATGRPGVSVVWGPWSGDGGMTARLSDADLARMARTGLAALPARRGLELLDLATRHNHPVVVAAQWTAPSAPARSAPAGEAPRGGTARSRLLNVVCHEIAVVLGHPSASTVDPHGAFARLGVDSLTVVELRNRLAEVVGVRLPATFIYDWTNPVQLVDHLQTVLDAPAKDGTS
jgi:acyl carrier protein